MTAQTSTPSCNPADPVSILAVIVVFKKLPSDSPSVRSLCRAAAIAAGQGLRLQILVCDNTPGGQDPGPLPDGVQYRALPDNPGLAVPYNQALAAAAEDGYSWLLTLDQDTDLPDDFLLKLMGYIKQYGPQDAVAAIVPQIADGGRVISPFRFAGGFLPRMVPPGSSGLGGRWTSALNSGSLLRVSALGRLGGYDPAFPLHNSDTRLYQRLEEAGKRVVIAGDIRVEHELAILQRESRMSPERYRRMLQDECIFWDRHMGVLGRTERLIRLAGRLLKGYLRQEDPAFLAITREELVRRLLVRRRNRAGQTATL